MILKSFFSLFKSLRIIKKAAFFLFYFSIFIIVSCHSDKKNNSSNQTNSCTTSLENSWNGQYPITLYIHSSFPTEYIPVLQKAILKWEVAMRQKVFYLHTEVQNTTDDPSISDGKSLIYWFKTWSENLDESEQGRTNLTILDGQILEADIIINGSMKKFSYFTDKPDNPYQVHLESLLIHELGHVLGLTHSNTESSIMRTHLKTNEVRTEISSEDTNKLRCQN